MFAFDKVRRKHCFKISSLFLGKEWGVLQTPPSNPTLHLAMCCLTPQRPVKCYCWMRPELTSSQADILITAYLYWDWSRELGSKLMLSYLRVEGLLVAQGLRICLAMQGTQVWSLVRELKSHMLRATKPACCNYWALRSPGAPESGCSTTRESAPQQKIQSNNKLRVPC